MSSNLLEGVLKQQFTDADGLLTWERKRLILDVYNLNLLVGELASEQQTAISLRGVKYAKEWSFSSPVCGFGFDLVWFSGKMWNFMSDEERTCKQWVDAINHAISLCNRTSQNSQDQFLDLNGSRPPLPPSNFTRTSNERLNMSGSVDMTMTEIPSPPHPVIGKFDGPPTVDKFQQHSHPENLQTISRALPMDSYLPQHEAKRYQDHTEYSDDEQQHYAPQRSFNPSQPTNSNHLGSIHMVYSDSYTADPHDSYQQTLQQPGSLSEYAQPPVHYNAVMVHQNSEYHALPADPVFINDGSVHTAAHKHECIQQPHRHTASPLLSSANTHHLNRQDGNRTEHTDQKSLASNDSRIAVAPHRSTDSVSSVHSNRGGPQPPGAAYSTDTSLHQDLNRSTQSGDHNFTSQQWASQESIDAVRHASGALSSVQDSSVQNSGSAPQPVVPQGLHFNQLSNSSLHHSGGAELPSAYNSNFLSSASQYATSNQQQAETRHHTQHLSAPHTLSVNRSSAHLLTQEQILAPHALSVHSPNADLLAQELTTWQAKCQLLETQLERRNKELSSTSTRLNELQDQWDERQREYEERLDKARDKERQLISESKRELESKLVRQSNDASSHFEAAQRALAAQHMRETECLREELQQERKRNKQLLEETKKLDEKRKTSLEHTQHDLASLREKYTEIEEKNEKLKKEIENNLKYYEKEKNILIEHNNNIIKQSQTDYETLLINKNKELNIKIKEINEKMNNSLTILNEENKKLIVNQYNNEKIVLINELNKKLQIEIEKVRSEERKMANINIENIKNSFLKRENETSTDLIALEELHAKRIEELNQKIINSNQNNQNKTIEIQKLKKEIEFLENNQNENNQKLHESIHEYKCNIEKMHSELINAYNTIEIYKNQEKLYKNELSNNITKIRMYSAELIEVKTQLTHQNQEYIQKNLKDSELTVMKLQTLLDISKNEIVMLENANKYIENENIQLKKELTRSDRLIYGVQMNHPYHSNSNNTTAVATTTMNNCNYNQHNNSCSNNMKRESLEQPISALSTKHLFRQPLRNNPGFSPATPTTNNKLYAATISSTAKTTKR